MIRSTIRTIADSLAPHWLREGEYGLVNYSLDLIMDAALERVRQGALARFPEHCPADALPLHGQDRRTQRGLFETDAEYKRRLTKWIDSRQTWGGPFAVMRALRAYLGPQPHFRIVDQSGNWYTLDNNGEQYFLQHGNWDWDSETNPNAAAEWARFWLVIVPRGLWDTIASYNDGTTWGIPDRTWGINATPSQVLNVRKIVNDWKRAGSVCGGIIVSIDPFAFGPSSSGNPNGWYGKDSRVVAGVVTPTRRYGAVYWEGT
jgi:hypothetical protein